MTEVRGVGGGEGGQPKCDGRVTEGGGVFDPKKCDVIYEWSLIYMYCGAHIIRPIAQMERGRIRADHVLCNTRRRKREEVGRDRETEKCRVGEICFFFYASPLPFSSLCVMS